MSTFKKEQDVQVLNDGVWVEAKIKYLPTNTKITYVISLVNDIDIESSESIIRKLDLNFHLNTICISIYFKYIIGCIRIPEKRDFNTSKSAVALKTLKKISKGQSIVFQNQQQEEICIFNDPFNCSLMCSDNNGVTNLRNYEEVVLIKEQIKRINSVVSILLFIMANNWA